MTDNDLKRSNSELEFPAKSQILKKLTPGEFYAFGPALSSEVQRIAIGPVVTTHPKSGSRRQISNPPPPESLKDVLAALRALSLPPAPAGETADPEAGTQSDRPSRVRAASRKQKGREASPVFTTPATKAAHQPLPAAPSPLEHSAVAALLAEKEAQLQRLQAQVETLSRIKVSLDGSLFALTDLPTVLHFDALNSQVQQAVIEVRQLLGSAPLPVEGTVERSAAEREAQPAAPAQTAPVVPELLYSEKKLLAKLVAQVQALSPSEKAMFAWLIEHDETKMSSQQLADAVGMVLSVTWSRQTRKLVKLPFIGRWGTRQFWYQAVFGEYCQKYFASVPDRQFILQQLLAAAQ